MAIFPLLSTNAVTQYPSSLTTGEAVQVIRFLDGSDQRYLTQGRALRSWEIRLSALNENEICALEGFFQSVGGDYTRFNFPDPFTGVEVPNCRLAAGSLVTEYVNVNSAATSFWVIETNG